MTDLYPFLSSFMVIAAAELGDKTQLLTFGFAACYPFWEVITAVFCATGILMAAAVLLGGLIYHLVPQFYLQLTTGSAFLFFGLWTLMGKEEEGEKKEGKAGRSPFFIVFSAFFLAELGDKTQLATLALSACYGAPLLVWLGATLGMVAVNVASVIAGGWIRKHIPEARVRSAGAAVFLIFGLWTLGELFFR